MRRFRGDTNLGNEKFKVTNEDSVVQTMLKQIHLLILLLF